MRGRQHIIDKLTWKQRRFCEFYIIDWNGAKAYRQAYPAVKSDAASRANASKLLAKKSVTDYIKGLTSDLEKAAGVSKLGIILEHKKLAYSSIAHLHLTWITRKEFEELTDDQKACIAEISTQTRTIIQNEQPVEVEFVRVKLYDKQKSLDSLSKLMGYDRDIIERLPDDQLDWLLLKLQNNKKT